MDMVSGRAAMASHILVSGFTLRRRDTVYTSLPMATNTRVSGMSVFVTVTAPTSSPMVTAMLASTRRASQKASANISGRMEVVTQANSSTVSSTAKENGRRRRQTRMATPDAISTRVCIATTRSMVTVCLSGSLATDMRATTWRMRDMAME